MATFTADKTDYDQLYMKEAKHSPGCKIALGKIGSIITLGTYDPVGETWAHVISTHDPDDYTGVPEDGISAADEAFSDAVRMFKITQG